MGKKIIDEFTALPVSRERKRQLRKRKKGRCIVPGCWEPPVSAERCVKHRVELAMADHVKRNCGEPYKSKWLKLAG